jgi:hypothetical protein
VDISKILDSLKLSPKYLFAVLAAGSFLLFVPATFLDHMGLAQFRQRFLPYVGVITLLSASLLFTHGAAFVVDWLKSKRNLNLRNKLLRSLTSAEMEALRPYIVDDANTQEFEIGSGIAGGLEAKRILYRSSSLSFGFHSPYNIQPWAREYLKRHPELLN